MNQNSSHSNIDLRAMARQVMTENGFDPDLPAAATQQLAQINQQDPLRTQAADTRDLRGTLWSSIDNDTSRDLDQIEFAEAQPDGRFKVMIAIADVDAFVPKGSPIDVHAAKQTSTVYTGVENFAMLPEELSTGKTSLLEGQDRLAVVTQFTVTPGGEVETKDFYRALVNNKAQLAYDSVGAWLEGRAEAPPKVAQSVELQAQLKLQDQVAQMLRQDRYEHGALNIETIETRPILQQQEVVDIRRQEKNRATELIEDFMIASNGAVARLMEEKKMSSIRRVVKTPKRWDRIVELAATEGEKLPEQPDSKALNDFLTKRRQADPDRFAELSLSVLKLMGSGEYILERPGDPEQGHFGLAVQDYTHSTAPNRRFPDVVSQRILKAVLQNKPNPYSDDELAQIAQNCTAMENAARKVERSMTKRIAAVAMQHRIGETFDAIVTGVTPKGTFVRVQKPVVEGLLARGEKGVDVGDKLKVQLLSADPRRGFIDFGRR